MSRIFVTETETRSSLWFMGNLEAIADIQRLKYRYFRSLDLKDWDTFGDCLAADVVTRYGTHAMGEPVHYEGRDAVVDFMRTNLDNGIITTHIASHPEIDLDSDTTAHGSWVFEDTVIVPGHAMIRGSGYYADTYRKDEDGVWRIASTGYQRIYEALTSLEDMPSFKLLANRWA